MRWMSNTLFIASFPDLSIFDFSKTGISISTIDNSDYFFNTGNSKFDYLNSYVNSLKNRIGNCDIVFVPANDKIISALSDEGIKCIVLYPSKNSKEEFLKDLQKAKVDDDYIQMINDSWDFMISRLDKRNYDYKFVMEKNDNILDVLRALLSKRDVLGISRETINIGISDDLVNNLFTYCLLREDEVDDINANLDSTFCQGIKYDYVFSKERINDKRDKIFHLIDSIKAIDDGISVLNMGITKDGKKWTDSFDTLEKVMVLGLSSGELFLPFPREFDASLMGNVPYVIRSSSYIKETCN